MNYLMFVCTDGEATAEKAEVMPRETPRWVDEMDGRGVRLWGERLEDPDQAVTVSVRDRQTILTDGPFVETKEFIAGFDLLECADLDEAVEVAAKHPVSWFHSVELRPVERALAGTCELAAPAAGRRRFALLIPVDGIPAGDEQEAAVNRDGEAWYQRLHDQGKWVLGRVLCHPDTATTVRVRGGETLLSDGPFAETKEFVAGLAVLDLDSIDEAIELAAAHPIARHHRIEVRPFFVWE